MILKSVKRADYITLSVGQWLEEEDGYIFDIHRVTASLRLYNTQCSRCGVPLWRERGKPFRYCSLLCKNKHRGVANLIAFLAHLTDQQLSALGLQRCGDKPALAKSHKLGVFFRSLIAEMRAAQKERK